MTGGRRRNSAGRRSRLFGQASGCGTRRACSRGSVTEPGGDGEARGRGASRRVTSLRWVLHSVSVMGAVRHGFMGGLPRGVPLCRAPRECRMWGTGGCLPYQLALADPGFCPVWFRVLLCYMTTCMIVVGCWSCLVVSPHFPPARLAFCCHSCSTAICGPFPTPLAPSIVSRRALPLYRFGRDRLCRHHADVHQARHPHPPGQPDEPL